MKGEFHAAISQLSLERGISRELLIRSVEDAVEAVYKRTYNDEHDIEVHMDGQTGQPSVHQKLHVVESVEDPNTEISVPDARAVRKDVKLGDVLTKDVTPSGFGRIAAQMTKQVMLQKIREAEHDTVYNEFIDREAELVTGLVQRFETNGLLIVELGKAEAIMPRTEQVESESYRPGQRLKVLLQKVQKTPRGPQMIVSRRDKNLLKRLFEIEVPEIFNGTVEIKAISRVAGVRSKVAVFARQPGIDPVGSCVGVRGIRVQNVVDEVYGEKIDIIPYSEDHATFIAQALSPAQVASVSLDPDGRTATVVVPERQLSLAIGKDGQNARLAANLTGWRIDIRSLESLLQEDPVALDAEDAPGAAAPAGGPAPDDALEVGTATLEACDPDSSPEPDGLTAEADGTPADDVADLLGAGDGDERIAAGLEVQEARHEAAQS